MLKKEPIMVCGRVKSQSSFSFFNIGGGSLDQGFGIKVPECIEHNVGLIVLEQAHKRRL